MIARSHSKNIGETALIGLASIGLGLVVGVTAHAQGQSNPPASATKPGSAQPAKPGSAETAKPRGTPGAPQAVPAGVPLPPDYIIGTDDVLSIVYWREKDISADVTVRPDGKISLPLLNEIQAAG